MKPTITFSKHTQRCLQALAFGLFAATILYSAVAVNFAFAQSDTEVQDTETDRIFELIGKYDAGTINDAELKELEAVGITQESLSTVDDLDEDQLFESEPINSQDSSEESAANSQDQTSETNDLATPSDSVAGNINIPVRVFYALLATNILLIICSLAVLVRAGRRNQY